MSEFLAEIYLPRDDTWEAAARARAAAGDLGGSGLPVRRLQAIYVPDDETCFVLFEAPSEAAVRAAAGWADLACTRVVEAYGSGSGDSEEDLR